jgi:lipopolysaccharide transport protein LptA
LVAAGLLAQTPTDPRAGHEILIDADHFEYDSQIGVAIYRGNVRVNDPQMELTCEVLTVRLPAAGGTVESIVAEQSVVILNKQDKSRATGAKAVYTSASEVVELTGDPRIETPQGVLTGDVVLFDRAKNKLRATGKVHMKLRPDALKQPNLLAPKNP